MALMRAKIGETSVHVLRVASFYLSGHKASCRASDVTEVKPAHMAWPQPWLGLHCVAEVLGDPARSSSVISCRKWLRSREAHLSEVKSMLLRQLE